MKVSIKSLVEQVVKEEINKLDSPTNNDKPLKEENAYNLKKGEIYTWTMGAGPFKVKYLGRTSENPDIKPGVSVGKGHIFEFIEGKSDKNNYVEVGPKTIQKYVQTNEATTTMVTPDGKTLSPEQKAKMKMAKPGTTVVVKKAGELSEDADLQEKKAKESEEEAPAENPEAPAQEAPVEDQTAGTASSELNQHISAAIDSAAKAIEASQDAKYEKVLGKVIKNLTAAQASLADVEAVENKLNEQKLKEEAKVADSFRKNLRKELKSSFKNPEHIDLILKKYDKVAKTASKENRPVQKIAEIITRHALNEGLIKKGDLLN